MTYSLGVDGNYGILTHWALSVSWYWKYEDNYIGICRCLDEYIDAEDYRRWILTRFDNLRYGEI